jgi:hypothetical protein
MLGLTFVVGDEFLITDGPFAEAKEHIGGICVIKAADLDAALEWARKLPRATPGVAIEVWPPAPRRQLTFAI